MTRARYSASDNSLTKESGEKIPCHDGCRGLWKEGDVLMEGEDYKIYAYADRPVLAYPVMDESEDLWDDVVTIVAGSWSREKIIAELKEKFTITRKQ